MTSDAQYKVKATYCHYREEDEKVYAALKSTTAPLSKAWDRLRSSKTIAMKFNQDFDPKRTPFYEGMRQQLVSDKVIRAVIRLLREETNADLLCVDISVYERGDNPNTLPSTHISPILKEFGIPYINANLHPLKTYKVPGGGQMFSQYVMSEKIMEADALVDIQRCKNHAFMGVTLTLKNLFGLVPMREPEGRSRHYFHHLVRMPYMLADIGRLFNPTLNIIDGLIGQAGMEWGSGEGLARVTNFLAAGDHPIATDACVTHLMGLDPKQDWPNQPFPRDRNAFLVAAEGGFGTVNLDEIDFETEVDPQPEGTFFAHMTDSMERNVSWRRTTCEQALFFRDNMQQIADKYAGQYILLQENEVRWHSDSSYLHRSRRHLAGQRPDQAMWLKYVDTEENEGEKYEVYENALEHLKSTNL